MLLTPLKAKPDEPVPPMPWRGRRSRGGGYAALMPTIDEFFGTSNQVCGGFWPFGTDMALPAEGVPVGRSLMTGAGVCCDPISWFKAGIIKQPSMFLLGLPAIGKSTFVRREVLGLSALGMNAIIPGDLKPDYASLVNMLGGQVIRLGAGIGVVNPLDPGDLHYALQRLEGKARKDLTDYYNDTRAALMEVLLTIMRTGRENDTDAGARGVTARESDILSVAVRVLHDRHGDDPQPPVIADLRDLLREGPDEVRMAAVWDDPENDELYRAQVRGLLADLHGFSNRMTKFGRLFGDQTTARIDLSRPVDFDISALAQSGDDVVAAVLATTWTSAFAAKNAADVLADLQAWWKTSQPDMRQHVDEMMAGIDAAMEPLDKRLYAAAEKEVKERALDPDGECYQLDGGTFISQESFDGICGDQRDRFMAWKNQAEPARLVSAWDDPARLDRLVGDLIDADDGGGCFYTDAQPIDYTQGMDYSPQQLAADSGLGDTVPLACESNASYSLAHHPDIKFTATGSPDGRKALEVSAPGSARHALITAKPGTFDVSLHDERGIVSGESFPYEANDSWTYRLSGQALRGALDLAVGWADPQETSLETAGLGLALDDGMETTHGR
ncbi:hypothetical protein GBB91_10095 [Bifidobacterium longum]|nr:hypothetical protein GBB91_10095 [Bifidobacterium longum]